MNVPGWLILDVYVMLLAGMLFFFVIRRKQKTRQDRTFLILLVTVIILLCGDMFSRCNPDGTPGMLYLLSRIGNYIIFAGDPVGYLMTLRYIDSWIVDTNKKTSSKAVILIVSAYVLLNLITVTISDFGNLGWFYSFPDRIYQRGPLYIPRGIMNMVFCLIIGMYVLLRKKDIRTEYTSYVIAFPIIVLFAGMLQVFVGGAAYEYAGSVFACLLLYIYVQNHNMDTDYLTGLLNRKGIDEELQYRIHHASDVPSFTTYLLDLDFFKNINDDCGHDAGDDALRSMSSLLRNAFGRNAVVGRYGGDEFLVIDDVTTLKEADESIQKLAYLCHKYNDEKHSDQSYKLSFSAGYDVYSSRKYPSLDDYIRELDQRMYREKTSHHALRNHS